MSEMDFRDKLRSYESAVSEDSWNRMEELLDSYTTASKKKRGMPYWLIGGFTIVLGSWLAFGSAFNHISEKTESSELMIKNLNKSEPVNPGPEKTATIPIEETGQGIRQVYHPLQIEARDSAGLEPQMGAVNPPTYPGDNGFKHPSEIVNVGGLLTQVEMDYQAETKTNSTWFYNPINFLKVEIKPTGRNTSGFPDRKLLNPLETTNSALDNTTVKKPRELHSVPFIARPELPQSGRTLPALDVEPMLFQPYQRLGITSGINHASTGLPEDNRLSGIQIHAGLGFYVSDRLEIGTYTSYTYMTKDVLVFGITPGVESMKYVAQHVRLGYRFLRSGFGDLLIYSGAGYGTFEYLTPWEQPERAYGPLTLELAGENYRLAGNLVSVDFALEFQKGITNHLYLEAQYRIMFNRYFDSFSLINSYGFGLSWRPRRHARIMR